MRGTVPNIEWVLNEWELPSLGTSSSQASQWHPISGALHLCGGSEPQLTSPEQLGKFTEVVHTESSGKGPGQDLERDSASGPEGSRDSTKEIGRKS